MYVTRSIGEQVLDHVASLLPVEEEWSTQDYRSLSRWPYKLQQDLWCDEPVEDSGFEVTRVHAETVIVRDACVDAALRRRVNSINRLASLNRLLIDEESGEVSSYCSACFHWQNLPWLRGLFVHAVALQAAEAWMFAANSPAELLGGEPAVTPGPQGVVRRTPDPMLAVVRDLYAPKGEKPSPWRKAEFEATARTTPNPWVRATAGDTGVTAEFPFRGQTSVFQASAEEKHPWLGNGLLVTLSVPVAVADGQEPADVAAKLNWRETVDRCRSHSMGAWHADPQGFTYVAFLPAFAYRSHLLLNFVWVMAARSAWVKAIADNEVASHHTRHRD